MGIAEVDWQPLVNAGAALVLAMTPVLVALVWVKVHDAERHLEQGQQVIASKVDALTARRAGGLKTRAEDRKEAQGGKGEGE